MFYLHFLSFSITQIFVSINIISWSFILLWFRIPWASWWRGWPSHSLSSSAASSPTARSLRSCSRMNMSRRRFVFLVPLSLTTPILSSCPQVIASWELLGVTILSRSLWGKPNEARIDSLEIHDYSYCTSTNSLRFGHIWAHSDLFPHWSRGTFIDTKCCSEQCVLNVCIIRNLRFGLPILVN